MSRLRDTPAEGECIALGLALSEAVLVLDSRSYESDCDSDLLPAGQTCRGYPAASPRALMDRSRATSSAPTIMKTAMTAIGTVKLWKRS